MDNRYELDVESCIVWPAFREERLGGWTLRFGGGAYGRSNSVQVHGDPGLEIGLAVGLCEDAYRAEGLPCLFRIPEFGEWEAFDGYLAARGYEHYNSTEVQVAPTGAFVPSDRVELRGEPNAEWLDAYLEESGRDADADSAAARLMRFVAEPRRFARICEDGAPVGVGLGAVYRSRVWIFGMGVREPWRRRGYASAIATTLMSWACSEGATEAALQVTPANGPAIAVYEKLGFRKAYGYHYRRLYG